MGLEAKTKVGRQSDVQKVFEAELVEAGGLYYIVRSKEEAIERICQWRQQ